jgi:hypothetical protein
MYLRAFFPPAANKSQNTSPNSLVALQRAAALTKVSGVAKGVTGGTVGTGKVTKREALQFFA